MMKIVWMLAGLLATSLAWNVFAEYQHGQVCPDHGQALVKLERLLDDIEHSRQVSQQQAYEFARDAQKLVQPPAPFAGRTRLP